MEDHNYSLKKVNNQYEHFCNAKFAYSPGSKKSAPTHSRLHSHSQRLRNSPPKTLDLGVFVDPELNFESHIEHTVKRASSKKATILRNFSYRSKKVLVPLL